MNSDSNERMPAIFAAHGAPVLLDDAAWMGELAAWASAMPKPKSILMVSAHWEARPATLGATTPVPLVYDFYGFPEQYYRTVYPSPGAPALAARVRGLLKERGIAATDDPARGLDHGAYVPLVAMYPEADVPVLQLSMPRLDPAELGVDQETFLAACAQRLSHQSKLSNYHGPLLVFHAINDSLVELNHAQLHMEWSKSPDKKLVTFHRGDHNTILTYNWREMLEHLRGFVA